MIGLPVWGMVDAAHWSDEHWDAAGQSKRRWMVWQGAGAPFVVGSGAAVAYFAKTRQKLVRAASDGGQPSNGSSNGHSGSPREQVVLPEAEPAENSP